MTPISLRKNSDTNESYIYIYRYSQDPLTPGVSQKTYTKFQPHHAVQNMEQFKTNTCHVLKHHFFPYAKQHKP